MQEHGHQPDTLHSSASHCYAYGRTDEAFTRTMIENLTEKLQRTFKNLRGQGKLTEEHLDAALAEIRAGSLCGEI